MIVIENSHQHLPFVDLRGGQGPGERQSVEAVFGREPFAPLSTQLYRE
ncbi:hypothetical protein AB0B45_19975 [Nonomuraea sp. NPDC049152]